ncbi:GmrSD restriction endonuclease domain-containing protein [Microbacterium sp. 22242]
MDVKEYSLGRVIEGSNRYLIPLYQRRYSWEKAQYEQLWNDVVARRGR